MRAEPLVEGLLQVRGEAAATRYSILARADTSSRILEALESKSISPTRASAPVEGWVWLHDVPAVADISEPALSVWASWRPPHDQRHTSTADFR